MPDIDVLVDVDGERAIAFLGKIADFGPCVASEALAIPLSLGQSVNGNSGVLQCSRHSRACILLRGKMMQALFLTSRMAVGQYESKMHRTLP
jgi:hypothetical protein